MFSYAGRSAVKYETIADKMLVLGTFFVEILANPIKDSTAVSPRICLKTSIFRFAEVFTIYFLIILLSG